MQWEPFVISRVCHKWRVIATERCPELWTEFVLERAVWDDAKDPVSLLSLVLSHGAERSLEFHLDASRDSDVSDYCGSEQNWAGNSSDEDSEDEDSRHACRPWYLRIDDSITEQLLTELVHHCHRWRDVYLSIPARLFHLLSPIRGKLLALVLFSLDCVAEDVVLQLSIRTESYNTTYILDGAPLLETLSVSCPESEFPAFVPRRVPNLTSYTDGGQRVGDMTLRQHFLNIIRTSPHLKSFSIKQVATDGTFLRSLTLPGLKSMELYRPVHLSSDIHQEISSLYDLVVECPINENLIYILEANPDLTTLILQLSGCDVNFAQTIKSLFDGLKGLKHVLVPRLQSLTLTVDLGNADFALFDGLFDDLFGYRIEDRWKKGILRSVTVAVFWVGTEFTLSQGCREQLIRLKDEGMNVEFTSRGRSLLCL
ncbi:hypothetical protein F5146DRAFT_1059581 [Armillaria mellea]|nr:hypothetical protein F5146DRAFT_1059581 [Armillaria mellea]